MAILRADAVGRHVKQIGGVLLGDVAAHLERVDRVQQGGGPGLRLLGTTHARLLGKIPPDLNGGVEERILQKSSSDISEGVFDGLDDLGLSGRVCAHGIGRGRKEQSESCGRGQASVRSQPELEPGKVR